jgi:RNA polymerase sigma factor (sigma-70 family)
MATRTATEAVRDVGVLFNVGTAAGLGDRDLLARFASSQGRGEGAEMAFRALVSRHAGRVWAACSRSLAHHDAEDAFQAVFLVLARRGRRGTIRVGGDESLGGWLHGVGRKVIARALRRAARRLRREGDRLAALDGIEPSVAAEAPRLAERAELRSLLDAELARLPESFRAPLELCYREGLSHTEAADRLRWPVGTVRSRLARGRDRLRARLVRRGLAPSVASGLLIGARESTAAPLSPALADRAADRALASLGRVASAGPATGAIELARGLGGASWLAAISVGLSLALAAAVAVVVSTHRTATDPAGSAGVPPARRVEQSDRDGRAPSDSAQARVAEDDKHPTCDFRVVEAATSKPIAGAAVWLYREKPTRYVTDSDGRCAITLPSDLPDNEGFTISTAAEGFTPIRIMAGGRDLKAGTLGAYTVELDPAGPMGGRVVDASEQPIEGAEVSVYFAATRVRKARETVALDGHETFRTGADGRWQARLMPETLTDDDLLMVRIKHPDFISDVWQPTHPRPSVVSLRDGSAVFTMKKGVPVEGTVADATGRPIAGAKARLSWDRKYFGESYETETDDAGRFRFAHARPGKQAVCVEAGGFAPELVEIDARPGLPPLAVTLGAGRTIRGQIVGETGRPIAGASIRSDSWRGYATLRWNATSDADGRFTWEHAPEDAIGLAASRYWNYPEVKQVVEPGKDEATIAIKSPTMLTGTVVDAETNRPIERFRVVPGVPMEGRGGASEPSLLWLFKQARTIQADHYSIDFQSYDPFPSTPSRVRIDAEGYASVVSPTYGPDDGLQRFDASLTRDAGLSGIVRGPDGQPAKDVALYLATGNIQISIENNVLRPINYEPDKARTDADGRFWLARPSEPFVLVAIGDSGMAVLRGVEIPTPADIGLQAWGRIEGTARVGDKPAVGESIQVFSDFTDMRHLIYVSYTLDAKADDSGRFVFDRIAPGLDVVVIRKVPEGRGYGSTSPAFVDLKPGETARVDVGGSGRSVNGQLTLGDGQIPTFDVSGAKGVLRLEQPDPWPADYAGWPIERRRAWLAEYKETPEGRAYTRGVRTNYAVEVSRDGSFRIEDVRPGRYRLSVNLERSTSGPGGVVGPRQAATVSHVVEVPDGPRTEPVDLGAIPWEVREVARLNVGDRAPDFEIETLDGKPLRLADFRGRVVLLDFWATWCAPCLEQTPHLKAAHERFKDDERFALIGLSLDETPDPARRYVDANGLGWHQGFLGQDPPSPVLDAYGVRGIPQILLIGPDGTVLARDLRGERIEQAVAEAIRAASR